MNTREKLTAASIVVGVFALIFLGYMALEMGKYVAVYNYMATHNVTGDTCGVCGEFNKQGLIQNVPTFPR